MANKILTNSITDPTILQPWTGPELEYLQNGIIEQIAGLASGMIGSSYTGSTGFRIYGLESYGTNQYKDGYLFYNGELFYSSGKTSTSAFTGSPVFVLTTTNDSTVDPLTFSDGVQRNVTNTRRMNLVDAVSGTGTFDYSSLVGFKESITLLNSFTSLATPTYRMGLNGDVHISGIIVPPGVQTHFGTLPAKYWPTITKYFSIVNIPGPGVIDVVLLTITSSGVMYVTDASGSALSASGNVYIQGIYNILD